MEIRGRQNITLRCFIGITIISVRRQRGIIIIIFARALETMYIK
jgi:hypothetical protein